MPEFAVIAEVEKHRKATPIDHPKESVGFQHLSDDYIVRMRTLYVLTDGYNPTWLEQSVASDQAVGAAVDFDFTDNPETYAYSNYARYEATVYNSSTSSQSFYSASNVLAGGLPYYYSGEGISISAGATATVSSYLSIFWCPPIRISLNRDYFTLQPNPYIQVKAGSLVRLIRISKPHYANKTLETHLTADATTGNTATLTLDFLGTLGRYWQGTCAYLRSVLYNTSTVSQTAYISIYVEDVNGVVKLCYRTSRSLGAGATDTYICVLYLYGSYSVPIKKIIVKFNDPANSNIQVKANSGIMVPYGVR